MVDENVYYVYELIDPRTNEPFYIGIGKGSGNRIKEYYKDNPNIGEHTQVVIDDIKLSGNSVQSKILFENLSEKDALEIEGLLIKKYGRITKDPGGKLTNIKSDTEKKSTNSVDKYATIQINRNIKKQITEYCYKNGLKISGFIEHLFQNAISGSVDSYLEIVENINRK